jgi:hypothetical protein
MTVPLSGPFLFDRNNSENNRKVAEFLDKTTN